MQESKSEDVGVGALLRALRRRSGAEHAVFKPQLIERAMVRRAAARELAKSEYVRLAADDPEELERLVQETLVKTTAFFRDADAFAVLAREIERIVDERPTNTTLRIWSIGCSTGEEPYSIALLVCEALERRGKRMDVRIFATDVSTDAIEIARRATFSDEQIRALAESRRDSYFERDREGWRLRAEVRRMVIFGVHDVLEQAPFVRLDVVTCRNVLIYLRPAVQERLLAAATYGLSPGGTLLLGPSEDLGAVGALYETVDEPARVFRRSAIGAERLRPQVIRNVLTSAARRLQRDARDIERDVRALRRPELITEVRRSHDAELLAQAQLDTLAHELLEIEAKNEASRIDEIEDALFASRVGLFGTARDLRIRWSTGYAFGQPGKTLVGRTLDTLLCPAEANALVDLASLASVTDAGARRDISVRTPERTTLYTVHVAPSLVPTLRTQFTWYVHEALPR